MLKPQGKETSFFICSFSWIERKRYPQLKQRCLPINAKHAAPAITAGQKKNMANRVRLNPTAKLDSIMLLAKAVATIFSTHRPAKAAKLINKYRLRFLIRELSHLGQ